MPGPQRKLRRYFSNECSSHLTLRSALLPQGLASGPLSSLTAAPPPGHGDSPAPGPCPPDREDAQAPAAPLFSAGRWPVLPSPPSSPEPGTALAPWVLGLGSDWSPSTLRPASASLSGAAAAQVRGQWPPRTLHGACVTSSVLQNSRLKTSQETPSPGGGSDLFLRTYYGNEISIFIGNGN